MKNKNNFRLGVVILTGVFLNACSSSPTPNYYTLQAKATPITNSGVRVIEVMPVGLPDRLDRASIVVQDHQGRSKVLDNDRWTSTLSTQLRDGLSAGLQQNWVRSIDIIVACPLVRCRIELRLIFQILM